MMHIKYNKEDKKGCQRNKVLYYIIKSFSEVKIFIKILLKNRKQHIIIKKKKKKEGKKKRKRMKEERKKKDVLSVEDALM